MTLNCFLEVDSCHSIGKRKELFGSMIFPLETIFNEAILVIEHIYQTRLAHIAALSFFAIDSIAKVFVISAHRLRNGAACTARTKEMTHDFLSSTNFCKRSVDIFIEVNSQRFLSRR